MLNAILIIAWSLQTALAAGWFFSKNWQQPVIELIFTAAVLILSAAWGRVKWRAGTAYILSEVVITFVWISTVFQMTSYALRPQLAQGACLAIMVYAVVHKIFWQRIQPIAQHAWVLLWEDAQNRNFLRACGQWVFAVGIVAILYVPDMQAVVARDFLGQQFHHLDGSFMGPAFAASTGKRLYVDHSSYYGLGIPVELAGLAQWMGGLTYERLLMLIAGASMVYFCLAFVLLRRWYGSALLAAAAVTMAIRAQVFQTGVVPIAWTTPQATVMRFFWDLAAFWAIFYHLQTLRWRYLFLAALACGVSIWHMSSTGIPLSVAFCGYLAFFLLNPHYRRLMIKAPADWLKIGGIVAVIPASALALFYLTIGPQLFSRAFLENTSEFIHLFMSSFGTAPYAMHLKNKNFMLLFMGLVFPCVYVLTMTTIGSLCWQNKIRRQHLLAAFFAVYGLGLYQYFVVVTSNYYAAGLPFFFVVFYWFNVFLNYASVSWRRRGLVLALCVSLYALLTCHMFCGYPNVFNFSRNPMVDSKVAQLLDNRLYYFNQLFIQYPDAYKLPHNSLGETNEDLRVETDFSSDAQLKAYYRQETDYQKDAALIQELVPPEKEAALVSSFEIPILMQAKRKPFFYYFPLINSRPLRMRIFVTTHLFTKSRLEKTIAQLEAGPTPYIFMEKIFLNRNVPQAYYWDSVDFMALLDYIFVRYEPYKEGQYLVALKRKDNG